MADWPLLSLVTFLPLVGVVLIVILRGDEQVVARNSRAIALWTSLLTFLLSLAVWRDFDPAQAGFQLVEKAPGSPASVSPTISASTVSRSGSSCSRRC